MKYEITIRQLEPYTKEEREENINFNPKFDRVPIRYSDKSFHEIRVLQAEVSKEEFEVVKKAIIGLM